MIRLTTSLTTTLMILLVLQINLFGQNVPLNDICRFATPIPSSSNYCSEDAAFTNVNATPEPNFTHTCVFISGTNGVWFSFVPRQSGVLLRVFGAGLGGTLRSPKIVVFSNCSTYLQCSPGKTNSLDELLLDNLNIGQTYYIMVESSIGGEGTFKLCVDDFAPVPFPEADCASGVVLCDKSSFVVQSLTGTGRDNNEIERNNCMQEEFQSAWYKWTCDTAGTLSFVLTPNNYQNRNTISDDIDFAVYELPNGIDNCANKILLRCMASGANGDGAGNSLPLSQWINCNGPTGLMLNDPDITESPGCQTGNNNFVRHIDMEEGKSYVLVVNNFSRSGLGFSIDFGGTGTFLGPEPDFEINANQAFECDKSVIVTNKSTSPTDQIIEYLWNFGDRANPSRGNGIGPFDVDYAAFGNKIAALTVRSVRGCLVTKTIDFYVQPCCKDTSTLDLSATAFDIVCYDEINGRILAEGINGAPEYEFSIDGNIFRPNPQFGNLPPGEYNVYVRDIKGCVDSILQIIRRPPPIIVDAGRDTTIEFGSTIILNGSFFSSNNLASENGLFWTPEQDVIVNGSTNPEVFPKDETTFKFTVTDENGCTQEDVVTIRVNKEYVIQTPNIFTPNLDGINEFFNIFHNNAVKHVEALEIYDRWGNLIFKGVDYKISSDGFKTNDYTQGWDGRFLGRPVNPGVYVWKASVRYIDEELKHFAGDITVYEAAK